MNFSTNSVEAPAVPPSVHVPAPPQPQRGDFRLMHRLRVRWAEVDMQNIVFNAHYLMYLDVAITEYWRDSALPFPQSMVFLGGDLVVRKATVEFRQSARMDDVLDIGMRFAQAGRSSLVFQGAVFRGDELLATGDLVYVYTQPGAKVSQAVPNALRATLAAYEGGAPMAQMHTGDWSSLQAWAMPVREAVFAHEQHIPMNMMSDPVDEQAFHAVLCNHLGQALATGRLVRTSLNQAKVGRMAVLHPLRGQGLGAQVLHALLARARQWGCAEVMLHAQHSACAFYQQLGFVARGAPFDEVGIAHQEMVLPLSAGCAVDTEELGHGT